MSTFEQQLEMRLDGKLDKLFVLEKKRRRLPKDRLVFVGIANAAKHWWCTQEAVLKSRQNELGMFGAYVEDRIMYAHRLGLIDKLPRKNEDLLKVGAEIDMVGVEELFKVNEKVFKQEQEYGAGVSMVVEGVEVISNPLVRGQIYQQMRAKKYASIRWNFDWEDFVLVGVPDGITKTHVYEYKSTKNRFLLGFQKPVATAQADLYGYFFQRPRKLVQFDLVEEGKTEMFDESVDSKRAIETLQAFDRVAKGTLPRPPVPWKCRCCDFKATCPISQSK